jgi:hypothetical protein
LSAIRSRKRRDFPLNSLGLFDTKASHKNAQGAMTIVVSDHHESRVFIGFHVSFSLGKFSISR